jgi:hypothetical protein
LLALGDSIGGEQCRFEDAAFELKQQPEAPDGG